MNQLHNCNNMSEDSFRTKIEIRSMRKWQTTKILKDFCESTSLHGYSYLYITDSFIAKLFWVIVIVIATSCGVGFLVSNTKAFMKATIVTNLETNHQDLSVS